MSPVEARPSRPNNELNSAGLLSITVRPFVGASRPRYRKAYLVFGKEEATLRLRQANLPLTNVLLPFRRMRYSQIYGISCVCHHCVSSLLILILIRHTQRASTINKNDTCTHQMHTVSTSTSPLSSTLRPTACPIITAFELQINTTM